MAPARLRRLWGVLVLALALTACGGKSPAEKAQDARDIAEMLQVTVVYQVSGTATSADITYKTPSGISQQQGVDVPLKLADGTGYGISYSFQSGDFVSISAQNKGGGDIVCTITVDDRVISKNTASGEYAIASCDGTA